MAMTPSSPRKVVAVFVDAVRTDDRDCLRGIAGFADGRPDWDFYIDERPVREVHQLPLKRIDGVIVRLNDLAPFREVLSAGIPAVNLSGREADSKMPRVCNDNLAIGVMAAEYFLARGYRHLAVFSRSDHNGLFERAKGFQKTIEERGATCRTYDETGDALSEFAEWARQTATPVAALTCTGRFAWDVIQACRNVGVPVPEKAAVLAVTDDDLISGFSTPRLSSVRCNGYRIGYAAAALLARQMTGEPVEQETRVRPIGVVTRRSTDMLAVSDSKMVAALKFIREYHNRPITCDEVAGVCGLHRRTLDRRFSQTLGRSVSDEIRRVRIESAKGLLVNTEETLASIALSCGFDYPERFSVVFKRMTGTTPSAYRQRFRG